MSLVFKNGYVLGAGVQDVFIENGAIQAIGKDLPGNHTIDATGKLIAPGFVDTHRHMAQAPLRGFGADMTLDYYLGRIVHHIGATLSITDVRTSLRLAAAEAMNAGVTTILDWSAVSERAQAEAAVDALTRSGLRVVFGHSNPDDMHPDASAVASLGPDYLPTDIVARHIKTARDHGLITSMHIGGRAPGGIRKLHEAGLLGPDLHFVHANKSDDDELKMIVDAGASLTITPVTELMMGHGTLAYHRFTEAGGQPALGVDVEINNTPDMFTEMHAALTHERTTNTPTIPAAHLLHAATINSATAIGLGEEIGTVEVGKRADLILLTGLDHLFTEDATVIEGAIATSITTEDVNTVLIDGTVVKLNGTLVDHNIQELREQTKEIAHRTLKAAAAAAA